MESRSDHKLKHWIREVRIQKLNESQQFKSTKTKGALCQDT